MLRIIPAHEEEAGFDHARALAEVYADVTSPITRNDPLKASADDFSGLDKDNPRGALAHMR
jgi:hypothetical protein